VAAAIAGSVVLVPTYLAELQVRRATTGWDENLARAFKRLDRAQSLNPLDAEPALVEGIIALQVGDLRRAREGLLEASDRDPDAWLAPLELGLIASAQGDRAAARRRLLSAQRRNPRSPVIAQALRRLASRPMTLAEAAAALTQESARSTGRSAR
ncbi:MAG TPA: tetratricopeptide repeat protein, partial [Solirubrobacteraceae bacterium]